MFLFASRPATRRRGACYDFGHQLARDGLVVERTRFLGMGSSADQSPLKRTLKALPPVQAALRRRLFASTQYHVARKPS